MCDILSLISQASAFLFVATHSHLICSREIIVVRPTHYFHVSSIEVVKSSTYLVLSPLHFEFRMSYVVPLAWTFLGVKQF